MTHTVRTTMQPNVEIEVSDEDYTDLRRWGLLSEGAPEEVVTDSEAPAPVENPASNNKPEAPAKGTDKKE